MLKGAWSPAVTIAPGIGLHVMDEAATAVVSTLSETPYHPVAAQDRRRSPCPIVSPITRRCSARAVLPMRGARR